MGTSVGGKRWLVRWREGDGLRPVAGFPPLTGRLLALRGVQDHEQGRRFLFEDGAPADPWELPGMERAVERLLRAIRTGERIAVYGDYDVDGVTATAILSEGLRELGADVITHIPNRFSDGYGLTAVGLEAVRRQGASLVVSVDCGVSAVEEIGHARATGMGVVVLDHHVPRAAMPLADAIVDPKLGDGAPPELAHLASCGLAYTTLRALYDARGRSLDEDRYVELVALGTVADIVPLTGENRRLVRRGLAALRRSGRPGVLALRESAGFRGSSVTADGIAFRLAPRLNAAGRLDHAALALELLTTADEARARVLAEHLNGLNARRQQMTDEAVRVALELARQDDGGSPLVMVGHPQISRGIVGLVASKLVETLYRPSIVYEAGGAYCTGSVRSIPEMSAVECLSQGADLLERWGGHRQAGGFTVRTDRLPSLKAVLSTWAAEHLAGVDLRPALVADLETPLAELQGPDLQHLPYFEPCGQDNPTPTFVSRGVPVLSARAMGREGRHLRLRLGLGRRVWDAVGFDLGHTAPAPGARVDIVYTVTADRRGTTLELRLLDYALSDG
jgi:single-stranded-DNA-specific exonuclease